MTHALYVSTRKGLLVYRRNATGWAHYATHFLGSPVSVMLPGTDGKTIVVALNLGHFGV